MNIDKLRKLRRQIMQKNLENLHKLTIKKINFDGKHRPFKIEQAVEDLCEAVENDLELYEGEKL